MKPMPLARWLASAAVAAVALSSGPPARAWDAAYVFGDSLSDSGNVAANLGRDAGQAIGGNTYVPTLPYASGTYSNGKVWVDAFVAGLGLPATYAAPSSSPGGGDYAWGGARTSGGGSTPSVQAQADLFAASSAAVTNQTLFVVEAGGNDVRDTLGAVLADPGSALSTIASASLAYATTIGNIVDTLQARGARHIIVWDAPNVGLTPAVRSFGSVAMTTAAAIATSFNAALSARLAIESGVTVFDVYGLVTAVAATPAAYGLTNVADACGAVAGCDPSTYLFWDGIHPTSAGHGILTGGMLAAAVAAVPETGSAALMAVGLVALLGLRRRRASR